MIPIRITIHINKQNYFKMAEEERLGDQVKKVIEKVVPKKFIPRDCGCGKRQKWLNQFPGFNPRRK